MLSEERNSWKKERRIRPFKLASGLLLSFMAIALAAPVSKCLALDNEKTRASLRGLPGFFLMVEDVRVEIEEEGLSRNEIYRYAEEYLSNAGIRVLSAEEWGETPGNPWLYLYPQVIRRGFGDERTFVFRISIEVKQRVELAERPVSEEIHATTWSRSILGTTRWIDEIMDGVEICLQYFVDAYRSVNRPQGS